MIYLQLPRERSLAYHYAPGETPGVLFCGGYTSDMTGTKALALEAFCREQGRTFTRFDYSGHGASSGDFADGTIGAWAEDALAIVDQVTLGPLLVAGSSMGGWIMLLVALARPERLAALVGIAAAPDFTSWGFSDEQKMTILREGRLGEPSPYGEAPSVTTRAFWESGEALRLMHA